MMLTFNEFVAGTSSRQVAVIDRLIAAIPSALGTAQKLFEPVGAGVTAEALGRSEYADMEGIWYEKPASFVRWVRANPGVKMNWGGEIKNDEGSHSRVFFGLNNRLCKCTIENDVATMAAMIVQNRLPDTSILDVCELDIGFYVIKEEMVDTNLPEEFAVAAKYVGRILNHIREGYVKQAELDSDFAGTLKTQLARKQVPDEVMGAFEILMTALVTIYETTGRFILDISEPNQPQNLGVRGGRPVIYDVSVQKVFERAAAARPPRIKKITVLEGR
jgi:hypothetical protein